MNNWKEIKFKDFITLQRGYDLFKTEYKAGEYPVVGATEIAGYHNVYKVLSPGITVGRVGSIGNVQLIQKNFWPHQDCLYIKDFKGNDLKYVYYTLIALPLSHLDAGGAVPALNRNHLDNIKLNLPPIPTQQRIASILSSYDELIEVNIQRIKLLEETALEFYKEWFVRLRFPNYKQAKFVKGMPKDWEIVRIDSLYKTSSGGTPSREKSEYYDNGIYNWVKTGELNDSFVFETTEKISEIGLKNSSAKLFPPYTTIFAMYGNTIGQLGIITQISATNQACCALIPITKEFDFEFLFLTLLHNRNEIISFGMGAAQQNVNQDEIKKYKILKPTEELAIKFKKLTNPIFMQIENLQQQNTQLRQIRNRLLPRLISGKLVVKNENKAVE